MATHSTRDNFYALFLGSYVFVIIFFDGLSLYPSSIVPAPLLSLQGWYKDHYNDQLVITQPAWFRFFSLTELLYQLPLSAWGIWALKTKSYRAPAHLLVWAIVSCGTTLTCLFEFYHNELMSDQEKVVLIFMYGLYAIVFGTIGVDMFYRIQKVLGDVARAEEMRRAK